MENNINLLYIEKPYSNTSALIPIFFKSMYTLMHIKCIMKESQLSQKYCDIRLLFSMFCKMYTSVVQGEKRQKDKWEWFDIYMI